MGSNNKNILIANIIVLIIATITSIFSANFIYHNNGKSLNKIVNSKSKNLMSGSDTYTNINNRVTSLENGYNRPSIELNLYGDLQGYGGFFDFHYNGSTADYTSRIIESSSGQLSLTSSSGVLVNGVNVTNVTTGTGTVNSTNTKTQSSSGNKWVKNGRLVVLYVDEMCPKATNTTSNHLEAISGLPNALNPIVTTISAFGIGNTPSYRVSISTDGKLYWHYTNGSDSCSVASGIITYISAS